MKTYEVVMEKRHYIKYIVQAEDASEAEDKAFDSDYLDLIEDPFSLPDSDYIVTQVNELEDDGE